jgi:hypothetical protein
LRIRLSEDSGESKAPQFRLVDEAGKVIDTPKFYAVSRGDFGEFAGAVKIPSQDFRIMVVGEDKSGFVFQRVYPGVMHPQQKPAPLSAKEIQDFVRNAEQSKLSAENAANARVWNVRDDLLLSTNGNPIGIHLTYAIRFPNDMTYNGSGTLQADFGKYFVYMQPKTISVNPPMDYTTGYKDNTDYNFQIDMWPFFLRDNDRTHNYCIWHVPAVDELAVLDSKVQFQIKIPDANFEAVTQNYYSPKLFYEGAVKEGAKDCVY